MPAPIYLASLALLGLCVGLSIWRGGVWERATSGLLCAVWVVTTVVPFNPSGPTWPTILVDGAATVFLLYGAVFSGRRWMVWTGAFQVLLMATHLAFIRSPEIQQWAYVTSLYLWGDLGLLALAVGTVTRKHGTNTQASSQDDLHARR